MIQFTIAVVVLFVAVAGAHVLDVAKVHSPVGSHGPALVNAHHGHGGWGGYGPAGYGGWGYGGWGNGGWGNGGWGNGGWGAGYGGYAGYGAAGYGHHGEYVGHPHGEFFLTD